MSEARSSVTPATLVNRTRLAPVQLVVFLLCALAAFLEGFDSQALAYVAPVISRDWNLGPGGLGPAFAAGLFGSLLGSLLIAPLSDRFGRRPLIVIPVLWVGALTVLTGWAESLGELQLLRTLTGLGFGATIPNALAMAAEYAPDMRRASVVTITFSGFALGASLGGPLANALVPVGGWQAIFWAGGAATLLACPLLIFALPESLRWLALRAPASRAAEAVLRRFERRTSLAPPALVPDEIRSVAVTPKLLFTNGRAPITLLVWLLAFVSLFDIYLLTNWLPTLVNSMGFSLAEATLATSIFSVGGILGGICMGLLVDRLGSIPVMFAGYLAFCAAIACASIGNSPGLMIAAAFMAGFLIVGCQGCNNALNAMFYPTAVRGTALGWSLTAGRLGSVFGPLLAAHLMAAGLSPNRILLSAAIPALVASALVAVLGVLFRRRSVVAAATVSGRKI
jgi:AAHS family 4-hydroxybenzoate transporter-like MFS transporter